MSLSVKVIDRLFERLSATYGATWAHQWDAVPMNDVKSAWAHELSGYEGRLDALAWALENLPERCPNVIVFKNLCRQAPAVVVERLPEPKADPERIRAELAKLGHHRAARGARANEIDHKGWARRIVARHDVGEKVRPYSLRIAREALRLHLTPEGAV
jgi:hypothetical protein